MTPNLAIASALKRLRPSVKLLYLGSRKPMDRALAEAAGIPFYPLFGGKFRRYFSWENFTDPFLVLLGFLQACFYVIRFWPDAVFAKGGFVSLPVVLAARLFRRPVVIHESDAAMGLANRLSAFFAHSVCTGFPASVYPNAGSKFVFTGNPVRPALALGHAADGYRLTGFHPGKPVLLALGGSLGSSEINDLIVRQFHRLKLHAQIVHITGHGKRTTLSDPAYIQFEYADETLASLYAISACVFSRAGANTLYELAFLGIPPILLPLRLNHDQVRNADYFESHGAAIVLRDPDQFSDTLEALLTNDQERQSMRRSLKALATPDAADSIAALLLNPVRP